MINDEILGGLLSDEGLAAVPIEKLMTLRGECPGGDDAITVRERLASFFLDFGISTALMALGMHTETDETGVVWAGLDPVTDGGVAVFRQMCGQLAKVYLDGAKAIIGDDDGNAAHAKVVSTFAVATARLGDIRDMLPNIERQAGEIALPFKGDEPGAWWTALGYSTFREWKNRAGEGPA